MTIALMLIAALLGVADPARVATAAQAGNADAQEGPKMIASRSVYVMRHLQRGEGTDPPLSEEGAHNARRLPETFAKDPPTAIYVSPTRRARETAAPLAGALGLSMKEYDPGNPQALIEAVVREPGTVLIVGHSNTVADIVRRLGGTPPPPLDDGDFGEVWHVDPAEKRTRSFRLPG